MDPNARANPDRFWDEGTQMWLTHSGKARWRRILAERDAERVAHPEVYDELQKRFRLGPWREEKAVRRPEVELPEEAAAFVEQHPDVIVRLADQGGQQATEVTDAVRRQVRERVRTRLRECRAYADSPEGQAAGEAWLAQHGVSAAALR